MFRSGIMAMAAASVLVVLPPAWAAPSPAAQREIGQLLAYLEASGCEFQRGGQWHNARAARDHIETKYQYLLKRDMVQSADDFIVGAATSSSLIGSPYMVRCSGVIQPSGDWLRAELARMRKQGNAARKQ